MPNQAGDKGKNIPSTSKTHQHDNNIKKSSTNTGKNLHNHVKSNIDEYLVQCKHILIHIQKYYILCLNVPKNVPFIEKSQLQSALQRVDKYILATQTISHLEDEHPRLKK